MSTDAMRRNIAWTEIYPPDDEGHDGVIRGQLSFRDRSPRPILVDIEAHSDAGGWPVSVHSISGANPSFSAGLTEAVIHAEDGSRIVVTWPNARKRGVPRDAYVSDVPALLIDRRAQRGLAALYRILPALGAPSGTGLTRDRIVEKVRDSASVNLTQPEIAEEIGCSVRHLQKVGGAWARVLSDAGRG